jgi:formate/nitrite transporter FocA (FNT family)
MAVRRVRRVIRKFDPWTVLKVSLIFNLIGALIFVLGSWVMWSVLIQKGLPDKLSDLADSLTITFTPDGQVYFRVVVLLAVIWAILASGVMTLAAVLYNLISDMVGGVEVIVLEETYGPSLTTTTQPRVRPAVHRGTAGNGDAVTEKEPAAAGAPEG